MREKDFFFFFFLSGRSISFSAKYTPLLATTQVWVWFIFFFKVGCSIIKPENHVTVNQLVAKAGLRYLRSYKHLGTGLVGCLVLPQETNKNLYFK